MKASYFFEFGIRRVVFCLILFNEKRSIFQVMFILYLNIIHGLYAGHLWARTLKRLNFVEIVNECIIQVISAHLLLFVEDFSCREGWEDSDCEKLRNELGLSMIIFTIVMIVFNMYFVVSHIC